MSSGWHEVDQAEQLSLDDHFSGELVGRAQTWPETPSRRTHLQSLTKNPTTNCGSYDREAKALGKAEDPCDSPQCEGFQPHARRDSNPQPSDP